MIEVSTIWELHSYHCRVPCTCGGEFQFELITLPDPTAPRLTQRMVSKCNGCEKFAVDEFDVTGIDRVANNLDRMLAKKWRPSSGSTYPMAERQFPKFSLEDGIETFSIMGNWQLLGSMQGSMSTAYLCAMRDDPVQLAVAKLPIKPAQNDAHLREAQLLLLLNFGRRSPHVVRLLEIEARPGGVPVWMLESVLPGPRGCVTLADWIKEFSAELETLPAAQWIGQIVTGLIHCGQLVEGFAHADLKPDNILVAQGWICKIADFGLAGWKGSPATPGAPLYRAPELDQGVEPSASSDIFSLGVIAYELFTGYTPWSGESESLGRLRSAQRSGLLAADRRVPEILVRCLELNQADRPTLTELQEAFTFPEVRCALIESPDEDLSFVSKGLIGLGMPGVVVKSLNGSATIRSVATRINTAIAHSQIGEWDLAEREYQQLAAEGVDVEERQAVNDQRRGLFQQSLDRLLPLIKVRPTEVGLRINASAAANDLQNHDLALELLKPAWESDPGNPAVLYQRAYTLVALKRCAAAKSALVRFELLTGKSDLSIDLDRRLRKQCPGLFKQ